jgi:hypothetical protein
VCVRLYGLNLVINKDTTICASSANRAKSGGGGGNDGRCGEILCGNLQ